MSKNFPLDDNEDRPEILWAEIHRLRYEMQGPDGFETWKDAAIDEKVKRVDLQKENDRLRNELAAAKQDARTAWDRHAMANRISIDKDKLLLALRGELAEARRSAATVDRKAVEGALQEMQLAKSPYSGQGETHVFDMTMAQAINILHRAMK